MSGVNKAPYTGPESIPNDEVKSPPQPVDTYAQEATNLHHWAKSDRTALEAAGLDWAYVEALPDRVGLLSSAEAAWTASRFTRREAEKAWLEAEPEAYEQRDDLLAAMRHAYRHRPDLLKVVREISQGRSDADMLQDLYDIRTLGLANLEPLEAIGVTQETLEGAAARSRKLSAILARREGDRGHDAAKELRNRAYTYLKEAVDEVRACGYYAFRKDERRQIGYTSAYRRAHRGGGGPPEA